MGGILANDRQPADFLWENLQIQNNLIYGAFEACVKKLLFLGSSCIYPKLAAQPLKEEYLIAGPLEPTNQWYAAAKIVGCHSPIVWDTSKPDGTPRKLLDSSRLIALGGNRKRICHRHRARLRGFLAPQRASLNLARLGVWELRSVGVHGL